ncbi:MAG TPA: hypothetical protein DEV93_07175 [Chloroflexi bacterium]|nr:hypothetical protein [Chloroflexota bacterium]
MQTGPRGSRRSHRRAGNHRTTEIKWGRNCGRFRAASRHSGPQSCSCRGSRQSSRQVKVRGGASTTAHGHLGSNSGARVTKRWRYNLLRWLGRAVTRTAAAITLEQMPPFVSASAVVVQDGRILAVVDAILGEPILPGGHLTWRESPEEGCKREVREETGLIVELDGLTGVYSGRERAGELGIVRLVYRGHTTGGTLRSSAEGDALWMPEEDFSRRSSRDGPILRETMDLVPHPDLR